MDRGAGSGTRAHDQRRRIRSRRHAQSHGRHDAGGRRLRGRGRRTLPGRHGRGQADRSGSRRLFRRQAFSHADRRYPRVDARRACHSHAQRVLGSGGRRIVGTGTGRRRPAAGWLRRAALHGSHLPDRRASQSADAPCDTRSPRCGRALHQCAALRGRRTANRPVRRFGRGQIGAARHDDSIHQGRCHGGRVDRRTRPRSPGFREQYIGTRRHAPRRGRGHAGRQSAAHAFAWCLARHGHCRILSRSGLEGFAAARFADPLRASAARDCAGDRRAARDQGLSALRVRPAAAARRARRQQRSRRRIDHGVLHRAGGRR